jgi:hypothetical protein
VTDQTPTPAARRPPCDTCPCDSPEVCTEYQPNRTPMVGVGMPAALHLDAFGREINDAFGHLPYLVGSAAVGKTWRDVDVRLMLPDDEFDALFPPIPPGSHTDGLWDLLCAALSELARVRTGLPVDFQIQRASWANERYPRSSPRHALGIHDRNGQ